MVVVDLIPKLSAGPAGNWQFLKSSQLSYGYGSALRHLVPKA